MPNPAVATGKWLRKVGPALEGILTTSIVITLKIDGTRTGAGEEADFLVEGEVVDETIAGGGEPLLEAHLFGFDGDLYGQRIEVEFAAKLRDEEKFVDLVALRAQMDRDAAQARRILADTPAFSGAFA